MFNQNQKSSLKIFLLLVIPQAVVFLMVGANVNTLVSVVLVMTLLWWQSNFTEQQNIRLGIIFVGILFIVYHFTYGFYLYNHDKNIKKVCGVFSKYTTKNDFKSSRKVLILYQEKQRKFYEFSYINRIHKDTDYFKAKYNPSQQICVEYVKLPILTMSYPFMLKSVQRIDLENQQQ